MARFIFQLQPVSKSSSLQGGTKAVEKEVGGDRTNGRAFVTKGNRSALLVQELLDIAVQFSDELGGGVTTIHAVVKAHRVDEDDHGTREPAVELCRLYSRGAGVERSSAAPVQAPLPPSDESDDQFAQLRPGAVAGMEGDDFSQLRPSHGPGVTTAFDPFSQ